MPPEVLRSHKEGEEDLATLVEIIVFPHERIF